MIVSAQERDAMARLMQIMNGDVPQSTNQAHLREAHQEPVVLAGAGAITSQDISAMADVMRKFQAAVDNTSTHLINRSVHDSVLQEALVTTSVPQGVAIGYYKIEQKLDESRIAGKQYYNVINNSDNTLVAHELSLYEAAHALVKMLNAGKYFNSRQVLELLEAENSYTSHKIDAVRYHKLMIRANKNQDIVKSQLMETRKQASMDRAMAAKNKIKYIYSNL